MYSFRAWPDFYYSLEHSYKEYIAQQYLKSNMDIVIAKNVREAVGSIREISQAAVGELGSRLENISAQTDETNENLEIISVSLDAVEDQIRKANTALAGGFYALGGKLDELSSWLASIANDTSELLKTARSPVQTWAFSQYDIACIAAQRKLFGEALEAVELAINGTRGQTGYKIDHRFHFLRGMLLSGIPGEPESTGLIDLEEARRAFLMSAKCALQVSSGDYAQAMLNAGRVAYYAGALDDAGKYYHEAVTHDSQCIEAKYQLARLSSRFNDIDECARILQELIDRDWRFAIRAGTDPEFAAHADLVEAVIRRIANQYAKQMGTAANDASEKVALIRATFPPKYLVTVQLRLDQVDVQIRQVFDIARKAELIDCAKHRETAFSLPKKAFALATQILANVRILEKDALGNGIVTVARPAYDHDATGVLIAIAMVFTVAIIAFVRNGGGFWGTVAAVVFGLGAWWVAAYAVPHIIKPLLEESAKVNLQRQLAANQKRGELNQANLEEMISSFHNRLTLSKWNRLEVGSEHSGEAEREENAR